MGKAAKEGAWLGFSWEATKGISSERMAAEGFN